MTIEGRDSRAWLHDARRWSASMANLQFNGQRINPARKQARATSSPSSLANDDSQSARELFPDIDVYDPATNQWQALAPMLVPRHGYGAAVVDGRIYLVGGAVHQGAGGSDEVSVFGFN